TRLTDPYGNEVVPTLVDSPTIMVDGTPPAITCPPDVNQTTDAGVCSWTGDIGTATADDGMGCGVASIVGTRSDALALTDPYPSVCPGPGVTTVTWVATDYAGNTSSCVQTIQITDDEPPVITCPADITTNADAGTCSAVLPSGMCYGGLTFTSTTAPTHFDDVWDLTAGDMVLTYTIDMSGVTQTAAYETPYVEVGLRTVGDADFNPGPFNTYQGGSGGWMTSLVSDLATNPNLLDLDDKHNLNASGGRGEQDYDCTGPDTVVGPYGTYNSHGIWFDRDGVDPWQATYPLNIDGATYNTGGIYDIEIRYHAITPALGTMFATVNGVPTSFDTSVGGLGGQPAGLSFLGDMTQMQVFAGSWFTSGAGGSVVASNICIGQYAQATDNCDPSPTITWVRSDGKTSLTDPYDAIDSPITITWTATDDCGNYSQCVQTITVNAYSDMVVTVELSPTLDDPNPGTPGDTVDRCITFEFWNCSPLVGPVEVEAVIAFSVDQGLPHIGAALLTDVPCGLYECITARDTLHTLRSTAALSIIGDQYVADFTGSAMLVGGNLNDDQWIDILDFGVFSMEWAQNYGTGDTTCATPYPHADVSGDGIVNSGDFTFININFLMSHQPNCCGQPNLLRGAGSDQPRVSISVAELVELGQADLAAGDLNGDGWLDSEDLAAFLLGARPRPQLMEESELDMAPLNRDAVHPVEETRSRPELLRP
ncbi:MAG: hypothetical protein JXO22_07845, partial [Phycisphaerae bacterium]|nr:hypothetical protein [Phycisphaerae bacterium]